MSPCTACLCCPASHAATLWVVVNKAVKLAETWWSVQSSEMWWACIPRTMLCCRCGVQPGLILSVLQCTLLCCAVLRRAVLCGA